MSAVEIAAAFFASIPSGVWVLFGVSVLALATMWFSVWLVQRYDA